MHSSHCTITAQAIVFASCSSLNGLAWNPSVHLQPRFTGILAGAIVGFRPGWGPSKFKGDPMSNKSVPEKSLSEKSVPAKYREYLQEVALTRRRFLQGSASVAGMLAVSQFLAACAPAASPA